MNEHDHSLSEALDLMLAQSASRRQSLRWLTAGALSWPLAGCGGGTAAASAGATGTSSTAGSSGASTTSGTGGAGCAVIPEETSGPYPGDGTNSNANGVANALLMTGIVRQDIRASIGAASGVAAGVVLTIKLKLVNVNAGCASLEGAAVYLWHCDRDGQYSMYASALLGENYLRGVQQADADGVVTFVTSFPGCYAGRMPHVHFEVYPSLAKSANAANRIKTSQCTFALATLNEVYASSGYGSSARNLASMSYASDNVFNDGVTLQMVSATGTPSAGYVATLTVGVMQ